MPPPILLDPGLLDTTHSIIDHRTLETLIPHRFEFLFVDGVSLMDLEAGLYAGWHNVRPDAFWVRGHIPGRPILPGVLMLEFAAQLACICYRHYFPDNRFIGLAGFEDVRYRGLVEPPCQLVVVGRKIEAKPRRMICESQGFVRGQMVFEGRIIGMPV